ncbi:MAG: hypothetical protein IKN41_07485 [Candidatus Methanomethylophilaceae archaeon]|nr:hypothetical protein [Candidatus Methanomethylophilaceae archaeon]
MSIPNLKKSEFADAFRNGVGQISALTKKIERTRESTVLKKANTGARDLSAYGFENFQVSDDIEVFVHGTTAEEAFSNSEMEFKPAAVDTKVTRVQIPVSKTANIEDYSAKSFKAPKAEPVRPVAKVQPIVKVPVQQPIAKAPIVEVPAEPVVEAPVAEAPAEQIVPEIIAEPVVEAPVEQPAAEAPVTEQPKIEEFYDQPLIIRPEIIDDEPAEVEAEEIEVVVSKEPAAEVEFKPESLFGNIKRGMNEEVDTHVGQLQDGFIKESVSKVTLEDYDFIQTADEIRAEDVAIDEMEIMDAMIAPVPAAVTQDEATVEAQAEVPAAVPEEEKVMLKPYVQQSMQIRAEEEDVLYVERAVPKLEDFIKEEPEVDITESFVGFMGMIPAEEPAPVKAVAVIPEWDVTEASAANFTDYISMMPEESTWAVAPVWEIADEAAESFVAYQNIWPQYPKAAVIVPEWDTTTDAFADYLAFIPEESTWAVEPAWDLTDEAVEALAAFGTIRPEYPKAVAIIPEWDTAAENYCEYLASIPEESTWAVAPVWDVSDEAADAYAAYLTIWPQYPKAAVIIPEWDVTEASAETYADYLASIPEESTWAVEPVWEIADETAESFMAFQTIRPEYPKAVAVIPEWDTAAENYCEYLASIPEESTWTVAPVWDVSDEASEAFTAFGTIRPQYPKAAVVIPEWDVTEAAVAGFEGYMTAEKDYFNESMMVVATTVSVNRIQLDAIERHVTDAVAAVSGVTGTVAETSSKDELLIKVKDNTDFNQENLQVVPELDPEKKVRTSRFVFKDGRLQKITEEITLDEVDTTVAETSATVSEDVMVEEMPAAEEKVDVIPLPAAQAFAALPAPVAKSAEGVKFSFGKSKNSYGSVRFLF